MGTGAARLFIHRLGNEDNTLFMSHKPYILKDDGFHYPENYHLCVEINIPDFFPDLKMEDGAKEVKLELCEEETGLYLTVEDNDFGEEKWVYNRKPKYVPRKDGNGHGIYLYRHGKDDDAWAVHINDAAFIDEIDLRSYSGVYNVKVVMIENGK